MKILQILLKSKKSEKRLESRKDKNLIVDQFSDHFSGIKAFAFKWDSIGESIGDQITLIQ